jgi:hypothetical protein
MNGKKFGVQLAIRKGESTSTDGFTTTVASNGGYYCYRYSYGTDGAGNVTVVHKTGKAEIEVFVSDETAYTIWEIRFFGDDNNQCSTDKPKRAKPVGPEKGKGIIFDKNDEEAVIKFSTVVIDETDASRPFFFCDPIIKNVPPT